MDTQTTTRPTIVVTVNMAADLGRADLGPLYTAEHDSAVEAGDFATVAQIEAAQRALVAEATKAWAEAAVRIGSAMGYEVETDGDDTHTYAAGDDEDDQTVEGAIWQAGHTAISVGLVDGVWTVRAANEVMNTRTLNVECFYRYALLGPCSGPVEWKDRFGNKYCVNHHRLVDTRCPRCADGPLDVKAIPEMLRSVTPKVGEVWHWEPTKPHASCVLIVTGVEWNGEDVWIETELAGGDGSDRTMNSLDRWVQAAVLLRPA